MALACYCHFVAIHGSLPQDQGLVPCGYSGASDVDLNSIPHTGMFTENTETGSEDFKPSLGKLKPFTHTVLS